MYDIRWPTSTEVSLKPTPLTLLLAVLYVLQSPTICATPINILHIYPFKNRSKS